MQFSVGVEYGLHSLFYMTNLPSKGVIGIKAFANLHHISETYLSKIFTKLRKASIVRSIPGVNGGYELMRPASDISFWDVVEAIEGSSTMFQCAEIRQNNNLDNAMARSSHLPCLIKVVMIDAEEQMRHYLREKSLQWLYDEVYHNFSDQKKEGISLWLQNNLHTK